MDVRRLGCLRFVGCFRFRLLTKDGGLTHYEQHDGKNGDGTRERIRAHPVSFRPEADADYCTLVVRPFLRLGYVVRKIPLGGSGQKDT